jgi:hypothetical protein
LAATAGRFFFFKPTLEASAGRIFGAGPKKKAGGGNEKDIKKNTDRLKRIKSWFFRCQFPAVLR